MTRSRRAALECVTKHRLGCTRRVDVRGIEEVDAAVEREIDQAAGGSRVVLHPERHRAKTGARYRQVGVWESSRLHYSITRNDAISMKTS
jgi:hypothetical protein